MRFVRGVTIGVAVACMGAVPITGAAQNLGVAAGVSNYDLAGTGNAGVVAVRYDAPVLADQWVQISVGAFRYNAQSSRDVTMILPEIGFFTPLPTGPVPLYLGAGAGASWVAGGPGDDDLTLFAAAGLDFITDGGLTVSPELRVRAVDPWVGVMADFTLGFGWYIGR